jgi:hypothetical protein
MSSGVCRTERGGKSADDRGRNAEPLAGGDACRAIRRDRAISSVPANAARRRARCAATAVSRDDRPSAAASPASAAATPAEESRGRRRQVFFWCLYDWANSAYPAVILSFVFAPYFLERVAVDAVHGQAQ